ncbi:ArsR/SmtB family transcription factor [Embleya sp. NPDC059259]|uniref:ArsR/SmtB family transcription factor n=1 Tax=unclassified Embleya TaxID=2699296 RepID=UPI0036CB7CC1
MVRIRFTAADFARVRFAPRPAPLQELNVALSRMVRPDDPLLFGRWRQRLLRALPAAVDPLADLVPGGRPPLFLDVFADSLTEGLDEIRSTRPEMVRAELERVYAGHPTPVPPWIRSLHGGDADAWRSVRRAQHAAFETVLGPVWSLVQDLHHAEFTRHALTTAEHGLGATLTELVPGSRLHGDVWEFAGAGDADIELHGRGLLLLPTFHWSAHPLLSNLPDRPVVVTYPAGPGLPLALAGPGGTEEALAAVIGRTRLDILQLLGTGAHNTGELARRLRVGNATVSAHTAALRGAGLLTSTRAGRSVRHERTTLGALMVGRHTGRPGGSGRLSVLAEGVDAVRRG